MIDPPRDYSVYDMSWVGPSASLISTVADLNRFYGMLLAGEIVSPSSLAQMQRTVPVVSHVWLKKDFNVALPAVVRARPHEAVVKVASVPPQSAEMSSRRSWSAAPPFRA